MTILSNLGIVSLSSGNIVRARSTFETAEKLLVSDDIYKTSATLGLLLHERGILEMDDSRTAEATRYFERSLSIKRLVVTELSLKTEAENNLFLDETLLRLGMLQIEANKFEAAIDHLQEANSMNANNVEHQSIERTRCTKRWRQRKQNKASKHD